MKAPAIVIVFLILTNISLAQRKDTAFVYGDSIFVYGDTVVLKRDIAIRNKLVAFNFKNYVGKTVKEFLNNDTIKCYTQHFWSDEPPMVLSDLYLVYARGLYVKVFVGELKYQPRFSKQREWDFTKYLDEQISAIDLDRDFFEENVVSRYYKGQE